MLLGNRSAAKLELNDLTGALADTNGAIERAEVCVLVLDGSQSIAEQPDWSSLLALIAAIRFHSPPLAILPIGQLPIIYPTSPRRPLN